MNNVIGINKTMNLNQLFKAKLDKEFPPRKYPCTCKFECEILGGNAGGCDNCSYCGTADEHLLDPEYWRNHNNYQERYKDTNLTGVF